MEGDNDSKAGEHSHKKVTTSANFLQDEMDSNLEGDKRLRPGKLADSEQDWNAVTTKKNALCKLKILTEEHSDSESV